MVRNAIGAFAILVLAAFAALLSVRSASAAEPDEKADDAGLASAVFAGGCFWCVEADFDKLTGVRDTVSGYAGGLIENPTYESHEGHVEAVKVVYDPRLISYRKLVDYHLRHIDPLDSGGQFCDRGHSYTTAIFAADAAEWDAAKASIAEAEQQIGQKIVTPILDRSSFSVAEEYHQDYYKKNPLRYKYYRTACGRDARVRKVWAAAGR